MKTMERIGVTEVLGKEIVFYNTWEEPLFLAKDVAGWIDYSDGNTSHMCDMVDKDEVLKIFCEINLGSTNGTKPVIATGSANRIFLTEDGIYEAMMLSRKPVAKELKKKVKQHLKQIRKTGGAVEEGREEDFINNYFPSFSEEVKLSMVQDLLKTNKELKPKAEYCDTVLNSSNLKTTTDIAKDLGMSAKALNKVLNEKGIIYPKRVDGKIKGWYLYSEYDNLVPEFADYKITEHGQQLKWTERGRKFILELLAVNKQVG